MCKLKSEAQFRKCAKGISGGTTGGKFLAHQGLLKAAQKKDARARVDNDNVAVVMDLFVFWSVVGVVYLKSRN